MTACSMKDCLKNCCETWLGHLHIKSFVGAYAAVFVWMVAIEMFLHGTCFKPLYDQTPHLWRTPADMQANIGWLLLGYFVIAKTFVYIYTRGVEGKGWREGARYGVLMAFILGAAMAMSYAWMPISGRLAVYWFITPFVVLVPAGILTALIYKPKTAKKAKK
jgi:hypothetical protein